MGEFKTRTRASRIVRPEQPRSMSLTKRDMDVLSAVNEYRLMRQDQIQRLFFPSRNTAQVRLQLLWQHGLLQRSFLPVMGGVQTSPILYSLDEAGAHLLRTQCNDANVDAIADVRWSRKPSLDLKFLQHTLGIGDIRVAVETACKQHNYTLVRWDDEKRLKADYDRMEVRGKLLAVLPDAYFVVNVGDGDVHFFVEYDMSSEDLTFIRQKFLAYWAYFMSGKCKTRFGTNLIRVLTVTTLDNPENKRSRLNSLMQIAAALQNHAWFWFSSLPKMQSQDVLADPIWLSPSTREGQSLLNP
jgi:hypothetical protein